ncbi:MAG: hypothetical protein P8176_07010 [Gammaproteobacteria bacterium]
MKEITALSSNVRSESLGSGKRANVLPNDAGISGGAYRMSQVLTPLIGYLEKRIHENPEAQDFRLALSDVAPIQLDAIQSSLALRTVSQEARQRVMAEISVPSVPLIPGVWNSAICFNDFFDAAGMALKKLYRVLGSEDKEAVKFMLAHVAASDVQKFFALPCWRGFSRSAVVSARDMSFQLGDLNVRCRGLSLPGDEGLPKLAFYRFKSRLDLNSEIRLIGRLDLDAKDIFTGFVSMARRGNLSIEKSAAFVANKPLDLEASFDKPYLFEGNRGARYLSHTVRPHDSLTWLGVRLTSRGEVQTGSQGNLIHLQTNTGTRREWHGVTFDENAKIVAGCIGNYMFEFQNEARKIVWKNVEFTNNGRIKDNQIGTKMEQRQNGLVLGWEGVRFAPEGYLKAGCRGNKFIQYPDGGNTIWEGVTFNTQGGLQAGCRGNKIEHMTNGNSVRFSDVTFNPKGDLQDGCRGDKLFKVNNNNIRVEWREVVFQSSGDLQAGTTGKMRYGSADKWQKEWQNVRFEPAGHLQTDDNGVTNGTYVVYQDDDTCIQWDDIKMSSQGRIQDGSDGKLCVSNKNRKSLLCNYRFNSDYTVKAGSKGTLTHIFTDGSKLHFVGAGITPDRQVEENNEMTMIREYANNKGTLTWPEIIKKDGVYCQKGQKGLTCEFASSDGQHQWFHGESMVPHSDFFLDNHTGELVLLSESQEVARWSPLPHQSVAESSRTR